MLEVHHPPRRETSGQEAARARELQLICARYPERFGQVRRVHYLWGPYYRINYHLTEKANFIGDSYFVEVTREKILEVN